MFYGHGIVNQNDQKTKNVAAKPIRIDFPQKDLKAGQGYLLRPILQKGRVSTWRSKSMSLEDRRSIDAL